MRSDLLALLPEGSLVPSADDVVLRLLGALDGSLEVVEGGLDIDGASWSRTLVVDDEPIGYVTLVPPDGDIEDEHFGGREITEADLEAANRSPASLLVTVHTGELDPVQDFHRQVQIVAAVAPEAQLVLDIDAATMHPRSWLWEIAECPVPPPPRMLHTIHSVYEPEDLDAGCWMHTHGLARYGVDELEALAVPLDRASDVADVLNRIAERILEQGAPPPHEPWSIGHEAEVLWMPWQEAVKGHKRLRGGRAEDREDIHSGPSMVFHVPGNKWLPWRRGPRPLHELLDRLPENPIFWVTDGETRRMEALAQLRWPRLIALWEGRGDDWMFLAKAGYPTDDGESREHLWFEMHDVDGDGFEGTCLNQPHEVARLHEGHRGRHALGLVSHWQIGHPEHGGFDPDSVRHLLRLLED